MVLWVTLVSLPAEEKVDGRPHLSVSRLLERRREFHRNLVNIVREHHKVSEGHPLLRALGLSLVPSRLKDTEVPLGDRL